MTLRPTTAAEALKQSKSGFIKHIYKTDYYFSFDKEKLVWLETKPELSLWNTTLQSSLFFEGKEWLPYDPEPVDAELLEAQKLVGQWVKRKDIDVAKKVHEVSRVHELILVWVSEPRCCLTDAPKEHGYYLVRPKGVSRVWSNFEIREFTTVFWQAPYDPREGDVWYALPPQGGK